VGTRGRNIVRKVWVALTVLAAALVVGIRPGAASEVGEKGPAVEPSKWLNVNGPISWQMLEGKLVLIEKWATW
jgi:hypothetical protein